MPFAASASIAPGAYGMFAAGTTARQLSDSGGSRGDHVGSCARDEHVAMDVEELPSGTRPDRAVGYQIVSVLLLEGEQLVHVEPVLVHERARDRAHSDDARTCVRDRLGRARSRLAEALDRERRPGEPCHRAARPRRATRRGSRSRPRDRPCPSRRACAPTSAGRRRRRAARGSRPGSSPCPGRSGIRPARGRDRSTRRARPLGRPPAKRMPALAPASGRRATASFQVIARASRATSSVVTSASIRVPPA